MTDDAKLLLPSSEGFAELQRIGARGANSLGERAARTILALHARCEALEALVPHGELCAARFNGMYDIRSEPEELQECDCNRAERIANATGEGGPKNDT